MITRSSIAFEDFLGSSIAPQVMPPWLQDHYIRTHRSSSSSLILITIPHPLVLTIIILILRVMQACNGIRGILRALSGFGAQPNPLVWEFKWFSIYMENLDDDDDYYGKGLNYLFQTEFLRSQLLGGSCDSNLLPTPLLWSWKLVALLNWPFLRDLSSSTHNFKRTLVSAEIAHIEYYSFIETDQLLNSIENFIILTY